jgi:hypothetical protein
VLYGQGGDNGGNVRQMPAQVLRREHVVHLNPDGTMAIDTPSSLYDCKTICPDVDDAAFTQKYGQQLVSTQVGADLESMYGKARLYDVVSVEETLWKQGEYERAFKYGLERELARREKASGKSLWAAEDERFAAPLISVMAKANARERAQAAKSVNMRHDTFSNMSSDEIRTWLLSQVDKVETEITASQGSPSSSASAVAPSIVRTGLTSSEASSVSTSAPTHMHMAPAIRA